MDYFQFQLEVDLVCWLVLPCCIWREAGPVVCCITCGIGRGARLHVAPSAQGDDSSFTPVQRPTRCISVGGIRGWQLPVESCVKQCCGSSRSNGVLPVKSLVMVHACRSYCLLTGVLRRSLAQRCSGRFCIRDGRGLWFTVDYETVLEHA